MVAVTRLGLYGGPRAPYAGFSPAAASIALTGTITSATEADIVAGGKTLILTVINDTWVATVGDDNAITTALINGLDSDGAEATGWDAVVKAGLTHAAVTRDSDTQVTILLPAFATYDITANETITATVPATALTGAAEVVASPTFAITFVPVVVPAGGGGGGAGEPGGRLAFPGRRRRAEEPTTSTGRNYGPVLEEVPRLTEAEIESQAARLPLEEQLNTLQTLQRSLAAQENLSRRQRARMRRLEREITELEQLRSDDELLLLLLLAME